VEDFAVFGQGDGASGIHGAADIVALHVAGARPKSDAAAAVDALHVAAGNAKNRGFHGNSGDTLRFLNGAANRGDRSVHIYNQAFTQALCFGRAQRHKLQPIVSELCDKRAGLCAPDVEPDKVPIFL
jgi:hypothetical protein